MKGKTQWILLALALATSLPASAGKPDQTRGAAFDCGQTQQIGTAADDYATLAACNTDKSNLQSKAVDDGNGQCSSLCTAMGCTATTAPTPLRASASCKADPAQKGYGVATTGSFSCRCTK